MAGYMAKVFFSCFYNQEEFEANKDVKKEQILFYGLITWDQAQFERFSYILSNGCQKLSLISG